MSLENFNSMKNRAKLMTQNEAGPQKNSNDKMLKTGLAGSLIAAICCFTPILVIAFVGAGLGGLVGGLDYFLFPMLFASLGLVAQSLYLNSNQTSPSPKWIIVALVVIFSAILFVLQFRLAITLAALAAVSVALYWFYLR
ncbi:hypothetical protein MNBD_ALPHA11-1800, partial [hydrothermal vent metagenome]